MKIAERRSDSRRRRRVGIAGAGRVGLVTAACLAELGHDVTVYDVDEARIGELEHGLTSIYEEGLGELLRCHRRRIRATTNPHELFEHAELVIVCVGTPPLPGGDADLSAVWSVVDAIPRPARVTLVMKSTVPVGTGARVRDELDARGLQQVVYVSNPEFLAEGTAMRDFRLPSRIVVGAFDGDGAKDVADLYADGAPIVHTDVASAEMIKYATNAFLATKISFVNEIANVCEHTGADVEDVVRGMALDDRIGGEFLRPGIGFGGSCFPKDVAALRQLAGNGGYCFQLLTAVIEVNELQKRRVVGKLRARLGTLEGKVVALLGMAFKPGTNDVRAAPSLVLAARLVAEGAHVRAWDPVAIEAARASLPASVELTAHLRTALRGADAAVVVTEWEELRSLSLDRVRGLMRTPYLVDGRNVFDPATVRAAGFAYDSIGRASFDAPVAPAGALAALVAAAPTG